jgi:hypothetical protein
MLEAYREIVPPGTLDELYRLADALSRPYPAAHQLDPPRRWGGRNPLPAGAVNQSPGH